MKGKKLVSIVLTVERQEFIDVDYVECLGGITSVQTVVLKVLR